MRLSLVIKSCLCIAAPIPVGFAILFVLGIVASIFPENWPDFFWKIVASIGLVTYFYSIYYFWKIAIKDIIAEVRR